MPDVPRVTLEHSDLAGVPVPPLLRMGLGASESAEVDDPHDRMADPPGDLRWRQARQEERDG